MKHAFLIALVFTAACSAARQATATTIVQDPFTDGDLTNGADPLGIPWSALNTTALTVANDGVIGGGNALNSANTGTFNRFWGILTAPVTINPGETLILSLDFRFTEAPSSSGGAFRFGLYNNGGTAGGETDDFGFAVSTNPGADNPTGTSVNTESAGNSVLGGAAPNGVSAVGTAGESFNSQINVFRSALFSLTRNLDDSMSLSASINGGTAATANIVSPSTFTFHEIVIGQGNINFDFRVDNVTLQVVPEPATFVLAGIAGLGLLALRQVRGRQKSI